MVTTIKHPETVEVANHLIGQGDNVLTAELVHPEELMSGLLSQVPLLSTFPLVSSCCPAQQLVLHVALGDVLIVKSEQ